MGVLTPEEIARIREEEQVRAQVRVEIASSAGRKRVFLTVGMWFVLVLIVVGIWVVFSGADKSHAPRAPVPDATQ